MCVFQFYECPFMVVLFPCVFLCVSSRVYALHVYMHLHTCISICLTCLCVSSRVYIHVCVCLHVCVCVYLTYLCVSPRAISVCAYVCVCSLHVFMYRIFSCEFQSVRVCPCVYCHACARACVYPTCLHVSPRVYFHASVCISTCASYMFSCAAFMALAAKPMFLRTSVLVLAFSRASRWNAMVDSVPSICASCFS